MSERPTPEEHIAQINRYRAEFPAYQRYADALARVLRRACKSSLPLAIVQARPKSLTSFAEKCVRKWKTCKNPADDFTDLCGARVIVHTLGQVKAVQSFVDENFVILEKDDKSAALEETRFGYRDMHYLVRLEPRRAVRIGFSAEEIKDLAGRVAELQVRTSVQHAWADILHDRLYKAPLKLSPETRRRGALLAAVMEDGDRMYDELAAELDGRASNYTAYARRQDVEDEILVQSLILRNTREDEDRLPISLQLAKLLAPKRDFAGVVEILDSLAEIDSPMQGEIRLELGHALCRVHRKDPASPDYRRGHRYLEAVVQACADRTHISVPDPLRANSLQARAFSLLAWVWEEVDRTKAQSRICYRRALETEPRNPYHLANQLGYEVFCGSADPLIDTMASHIREAIATCREHAVAGTELPFAYFTAGRLHLLLKEATSAMGWYSRGLRHLFEGQSCVPETALEDEVQWIAQLHFGGQPPQEYEWVQRLVALAREFRVMGDAGASSRAGEPEERVLIIAGGAATMTEEMLGEVRPLLRTVLRRFSGRVISGGTGVGIPGCVGEIARELADAGGKHFRLIGYIPRMLPADAPKDPRYDAFVKTDDDGFSSGQVLRMWEDFRREGVTPAQVQLLGIGGGPISAVEYRVALALGAATGLVRGSGGEADALLADEVWRGAPTLLALPRDAGSVRAFVASPGEAFSPAVLERMAESFHACYVQGNVGNVAENMQPWSKLKETYRNANLQQAAHAVEILRAAGFQVRPRTGEPGALRSFEGPGFAADVERMAELEHGRWNVDRLRDGWRYGRTRDNARKIHDNLVPWLELPDHIRDFDRVAIRRFPEILTEAGYEIVRR